MVISFDLGNPNCHEDYVYHNESFSLQPGVYLEAREDSLITNDNCQLIRVFWIEQALPLLASLC